MRTPELKYVSEDYYWLTLFLSENVLSIFFQVSIFEEIRVQIQFIFADVFIIF